MTGPKMYRIRAKAFNVFIRETGEVILAGQINTIPVPEEVAQRAEGASSEWIEVVGEWPTTPDPVQPKPSKLPSMPKKGDEEGVG